MPAGIYFDGEWLKNLRSRAGDLAKLRLLLLPLALNPLKVGGGALLSALRRVDVRTQRGDCVAFVDATPPR